MGKTLIEMGMFFIYCPQACSLEANSARRVNRHGYGGAPPVPIPPDYPPSPTDRWATVENP